MRRSLLASVLSGLSLALVSGAVACRKAPSPPPTTTPATWPGPLTVVVSIPPLKGLVEPLLPPGSTVTVLLPPGVSEHGFELTQAKVRDAINADMLIWIGGMEPQVDALSRANPRPGRRDLPLAAAIGLDVAEHDHGDHAHDHAAPDPHIWLDPHMARKIVEHVGLTVAALRPSPVGAASPAAAATASQVERLVGLDADIRAALADAQGRTIVVGHDAYGWLAGRYGLKTVAITGLTAGEPLPGDLQKARQAVRANNLKAVLTEPQLSPEAARNIAAETGAAVRTLDPLGDGDYFAMMRANLAAIRAALGLPAAPEPHGAR